MTSRIAPLLAALVAFTFGCVRNNTASVEPYAVCSMPDDCTFSEKCDAQLIGTPTIDVAGDQEMWLAVEMHNQLSNNADASAGRVNTHDAHFESYTVEYSGAAGVISGSTGEIPATGGSAQQVIPANGTAVIGFYPFPQATVDDLWASTAVPTGPEYVTVNVEATFKGHYDDGSTWDAAFRIPVRVTRSYVSLLCSDLTQVPMAACPGLFQYPRGVLSCVDVICAAVGNACGTSITNSNILYGCTTAGSKPDFGVLCANGCSGGACL